MKVKLILPALTEATSPGWRPIKYSLFPPLGLATLAAYLDDEDEAEIQDEQVERLNLEDAPDLVVIQVYITSAYRSYDIADHYRRRGAYVVMGGLHVTSLPDEAAAHADTIFLGPGEDTRLPGQHLYFLDTISSRRTRAPLCTSGWRHKIASHYRASDQLPDIGPRRQVPSICVSAVRCSISVSVSMLESLTFACHVPVIGGDPGRAEAMSADHEPRHPARSRCAAHVPCNTMRFPSSTVHVPCARLGVFGSSVAVQVP